MGYTVKGTIHNVGETQHVSDRFSKREFVIAFADNPKYPQFAKMEVSGDRCSMLDGLEAGAEVEVEFQVRGRLYTSKKTGEEDCFTSLNAWRVERVGGAKPATAQAAAGNGSPPAADAPLDEGDIPFASCSLSDDPTPIARVLR